MRFWFGRKSAPEAMACGYAPPPWLMGAGEEGFARSYEAQLREVYRENPVGLRAVRLVAGAIGGLTVEAEKDEAARLAKGVLEGVGAALVLHGNAYVQLIADSRGSPRELALLRPERVSIACDEQGHASAYVYRVGGRAVRIAAKDALHRRQVAHIRGLNPADDHLGLGCLDAAIAAASIHNRASRWNKVSLVVGGHLGSAKRYGTTTNYGSYLLGAGFGLKCAGRFIVDGDGNRGVTINSGGVEFDSNGAWFGACQIFRDATHGLSLYGAGGSANDLLFGNANGTQVMVVPAGGNHVEFKGHVGLAPGKVIKVGGTQVVGSQGAAIADAAAGQELSTINAMLAALRTHGLIAA